MNTGFFAFFSGDSGSVCHRWRSRFGPMFIKVVTVSPLARIGMKLAAQVAKERESAVQRWAKLF